MTPVRMAAVAEMTGEQPRVIRRWANEGWLPHWRVNGKRVFDRDLIVDLVGRDALPTWGSALHSVLRMWAKVEQRGGCWVQTSGLSVSGYGQVRLNGRGSPTHRAMYELVVGPVPDGLQLDHLCRNRACCNPWHLEPVTCRENLLRGVGFPAVNARKTHCPQGHALTPDNITRDYYRTTDGPRQGRKCKTCHRLREAARRAAKAAA